MADILPPPPGFTLDQPAVPPPPPGFTLDKSVAPPATPEEPGLLSRMGSRIAKWWGQTGEEAAQFRALLKKPMDTWTPDERTLFKNYMLGTGAGLAGEGPAKPIREAGGMAGEGAASAKPPEAIPGAPEAVPAEPAAADTPGPILDLPPEAETPKQAATRIDDALYRLRKNGTADQIDAREFLQGLPKQDIDPAFQAKVYGEIEQRMVDPKAPLSPDVEAFVSGPLKPWREEEERLANEVRTKLAGEQVSDLPPVDNTGYVHRVAQGKGQWMDRADPAAWGQADVVQPTGRSLSKFAASMQPRKFYVLETADGQRLFQANPGKDWEVGKPIRGSDGRSYTPKLATTAEIEANTGTRYWKNATINTVDNVLRLRRVNRNLDLLESLKPQLVDADLAMTKGGNKEVPAGWIEPTLPQFRGWAVEPRIAHVLNDYHGANLDALDHALGKINRFIVTSLFMLPGGVTAHGANVMNHWIVGRGWDWLRPTGWESLMRDGARAMKAVLTQNQDYRAMLREGSGLLYGDVANQNFYKLMLEKMAHEQVQDPQTWLGIAKNLGFSSIRDMVQWEYRAMSKSLWAISDMFMLQRQFELMRKGLPVRAAIREAERDIPNYRVPSEVMGSRAVSELIRSPRYLLFGRYKYGQFRALSEMAKDLVKGSGEQRKEAMGKLLVLFGLGAVAYPLADRAVRAVTGNPQASVYRRGPMSPIQAPIDLEQGQRDWMSAVSSIVTPAPAVSGALELTRNQNAFGQPIVKPGSSPLGVAIQLGEYAGSQIGPLQTAEDLARQGIDPVIARQLGIKLPTPQATAAKAKAERRELPAARRAEARDPVEQAIRRALGMQ